jgi:hypothetical protein
LVLTSFSHRLTEAGVDLLKRARCGQDILRVIARIVDDAANLRAGGHRDEHGDGHRQDSCASGEQMATAFELSKVCSVSDSCPTLP